MRSFGLLFLFSVACGTPGISEDTDRPDVDEDSTNPDGDVDIDTSDPATCTAALASTDPRPNHESFPTTSALTAWFTAPVSPGEFSLSVSGVTGSTQRASDGMSATFTPDAPLANSTSYTLSTSVCGAASTVNFQTASAPLDADALDSTTYVIDYDDVTWVAPAGASLISGQLPVDYILLHVIDANPTEQTIDVVGALGVPDGGAVIQDPCQETFGFGPQDFTTNPVFRVGPTTLSFPMDGQDVDIDQAFIEAVFVEGGDAIENITISGKLDTRPLDQFAPISGDLCTDAQLLGASCSPCTDGQNECLEVLLTVDRAPADDTLVFDANLVPGPSCR